jgi:hypothetical protein
MPVDTYNPSSAGTTGSFAGGTNGNAQNSSLTQIAAQIKTLTPTQFFAAYDITSTEQAAYLSGTGLNINAAYLAYYMSLGQSERQAIQEQMVNVGELSQTEANGVNNSSALSAFKSLIGSSAAQGTNVLSYLDANASGTAGIGNQISANLTKAQENATQPIVASVENPTTLSATLTSAFENALGYSPDQSQIQSFINQVQGQDTTYAEAPRAEAQAQINLAHSENSALNKLGPDGIDQVISAYQAAVTGTNMPGAGTTQGPQLSQGQAVAPVMGSPNTASPITTPTSQQLPPGINPTGPGMTTKEQYVPEGTIGNLVNSLVQPGNLFSGHGLQPTSTREEVTTVHGSKTTMKKTGSAQIAPTHFNPQSSATYGGVYALSVADWKEAQALYPAAKKFSTPGGAPQSVQAGAFTSLLSNAYDQNGGSWSKAISSIASGTPFGSNEGSHLSAFGDQVASQVNDQITALQSQVNNDTVTTKVSAPDATAEANLAAKQSDPTGYYAAESASWGEELNKMLSGTSSMYNQTSADTFTGPVGAEAATASATAPTTVGAGAP